MRTATFLTCLAGAVSAEVTVRPGTHVYTNISGWEIALIRLQDAANDRCIISRRNADGQSLWIVEEADGSRALVLSDQSWPMRREEGVVYYMRFDGIEVRLEGSVLGASFSYDYNDGSGWEVEYLIPPDVSELVFYDADVEPVARFDVSALGMAYPYRNRCVRDMQQG